VAQHLNFKIIDAPGTSPPEARRHDELICERAVYVKNHVSLTCRGSRDSTPAAVARIQSYPILPPQWVPVGKKRWAKLVCGGGSASG